MKKIDNGKGKASKQGKQNENNDVDFAGEVDKQAQKSNVETTEPKEKEKKVVYKAKPRQPKASPNQSSEEHQEIEILKFCKLCCNLHHPCIQ